MARGILIQTDDRRASDAAREAARAFDLLRHHVDGVNLLTEDHPELLNSIDSCLRYGGATYLGALIKEKFSGVGYNHAFGIIKQIVARMPETLADASLCEVFGMGRSKDWLLGLNPKEHRAERKTVGEKYREILRDGSDEWIGLHIGRMLTACMPTQPAQARRV